MHPFFTSKLTLIFASLGISALSISTAVAAEHSPPRIEAPRIFLPPSDATSVHASEGPLSTEAGRVFFQQRQRLKELEAERTGLMGIVRFINSDNEVLLTQFNQRQGTSARSPAIGNQIIKNSKRALELTAKVRKIDSEIQEVLDIQSTQKDLRIVSQYLTEMNRFPHRQIRLAREKMSTLSDKFYGASHEPASTKSLSVKSASRASEL